MTSMTERRTRLDDVVARTPADRDRFVDFLRALSIAVVVFGHWLVAVVYFKDGVLSGTSALDEVPGLWVLTWILQVMPLFFFVGGFSNLRSWHATVRRKDSYASFLGTRMERLLKPSLVFAGLWTVAAILMAGLAPQTAVGLREGLRFLAAPLWFLAVYVLVVALSPVMVVLHDRYRSGVLVCLAAAAIAVDAVRIGLDWTAFGYLNFAFVWLFAHQLGFFYGDGTLPARNRRFHMGMAATGFAALVVLTGSGIYSPSMVSMASERPSNTSPTSICLIAMSLWLVGLAMTVRPAVSRWLQGTRVWKLVVAANSMIMTVFLWHLTALLVAVLLAYPLGFPQPEGGTTLWWMWRPVWLGVLCTCLVALVALFGRFERPSLLKACPQTRPSSLWKTPAAVALVVLGTSRIAATGFDPTDTGGLGLGVVSEPLVGLAFLYVGYTILRNRPESEA